MAFLSRYMRRRAGFKPRREATARADLLTVGDGAKPDFLPEQKRTNYSVKWPRIGGQVEAGACSSTHSLRDGWKSTVTDLRLVGAIS